MFNRLMSLPSVFWAIILQETTKGRNILSFIENSMHVTFDHLLNSTLAGQPKEGFKTLVNNILLTTQVKKNYTNCF